MGTAYNIPLALRLQGFLDIPAMDLSLGELVRRHESLRTRFENREGQAVQIIDEAGGFRLLQVDVSGLADEPRAEQVRRLVQEEAERRFDLAQGPLFRVSLLKLGAEEHVLLLTLHHIISDGWSQGVMLRELSVLYGAFSQGLPSPLSPLPVQYADYALWQRGWLQGEVLEAQVRYWKERLAGAAPSLELPSDRPRPAVASYKGGVVPFNFSAQLSTDPQQLGRVQGATLYMVLLAAFQVLLSRWSGQKDILVGSPIAGRTHRETEALIGFFCQYAGDEEDAELLIRASRRCSKR